MRWKQFVLIAFACASFCSVTAMASSCGGQASAMLRNYGPTQETQPGASVAGSSSSSTIGELNGGARTQKPLTTIQQEKVSSLVKEAIAADGNGDTADCMSKLKSANEIIK